MKTIMVVDDEKDIVYLLRMILEKNGYDVTEAYSGEECLERLKDNQPDLIVLDVMMPGIDGWETCRRIKANPDTRFIPVIILSVKSQLEDRIKSDEAGAIEHFSKPIEDTGLLKAIEALLDAQ
jgi:two-component system cell cycle response regulator